MIILTGYYIVQEAFYAYSKPVSPVASREGPESAKSGGDDSSGHYPKPKLVVLGRCVLFQVDPRRLILSHSGWGAVSCVRHVDLEKFDVTIVV